ncbi:MAG: PEP-CTERM sorting domain-containing protein, partial [Phycisphaerae bacterium]
LWSNSTARTLTVLTAGFTLTNNSTTEVSGGNALAGSIIRSGNSTVTLRMRNAGANANTLAFDQSTLTAGEWYRLSYQLTKAATINEFGYTVSLFSIGADGASAPVLFFDGTKSITITGTVTNSSFYGDSNAFFGYDIRNTNGISQVDNFVVVVPEPASASLMIIGLVMLALFLRQRGTVRTAYFHISTKQKRYGLSGEQARVGTSAPSMAIHI